MLKNTSLLRKLSFVAGFVFLVSSGSLRARAEDKATPHKAKSPKGETAIIKVKSEDGKIAGAITLKLLKEKAPKTVETFVGLARGAADQGADLVLWDGEPQYKGPDAATRDLLSGLVTEALEAVARRVPGLVQGHTSYGNVVRITLPSGEGWGGQGTYVWRAWIGPSSPVEVTFPQVYPAISHAIDPGVLQEYARRTRVSYAAAVEEGLVGRQVAQRPYLLLHGTPYADTVEVARAAGTSALWALPGTVDTEGLIALAHLTGEPPSEALDPSAGDFGVGKALAWGSLRVAVAAVARWWQGRTR
jgi:hypothetical protein